MPVCMSYDLSPFDQGGCWRLDWFHQEDSYVDEFNLTKLHS